MGSDAELNRRRGGGPQHRHRADREADPTPTHTANASPVNQVRSVSASAVQNCPFANSVANA